jgi:predicted nuclease with TOPRIM domain
MAMNVTETVSDLRERRRELERLEENARKAEALGSELDALKADLTAGEAKRDRLAELGAKHVEFEEERSCPISGMRVQLEPRRSKATGKELAARFDKTLDPLRDAISQREAMISALLAPDAA